MTAMVNAIVAGAGKVIARDRKDSDDTRSAGGIYLPGANKGDVAPFEVVAVGQRSALPHGAAIELEVREGDTVYLSRSMAVPFNFHGETLYASDLVNVMAVERG